MPFEIPYRLETRQDILEAKDVDLLGLGLEYTVLLAVERRLDIVKPPALVQAHPVTKEFYRIRDEAIREAGTAHLERARIHLAETFHHIEQALPWAADLARCSDFSDLLGTFPPAVRERCEAGHRPGSQAGRLAAVLEAQKIIKEEALALARTSRTRSLTREDLKRLIAGRALFDAANEDVLTGLRQAISDKRDGAALFQNASAELLFTRIPSFVSLLSRVDPKLIRQKFLARVAKLVEDPRKRMGLFTCMPGDVTLATLFPAMEKMSAACRRALGKETADFIDDSITGFRHQVNMIKTLYDGLFLTPELRQVRRLHEAGRVDVRKLAYHERTVRTRTHLDTLTFHPVKDYLDLCKSHFSDDCTGLDLSEKQLGSQAYFCIRIFRNTTWLGNIYMLDFTKEHGLLVVDRIQIPRNLNAVYINFFGHLLEIFREMFSSVEYRQVLLPLRISNHGFIQKAWNERKKGLKKRKFDAPFRDAAHFESMQGRGNFYVLE